MITQRIEQNHYRTNYEATITWTHPVDDLITAEIVIDYARHVANQMAEAHIVNTGNDNYQLEIIRTNECYTDNEALEWCSDVTREALLWDADLQDVLEATAWATIQFRLLHNRIRKLESRI